MSKIDAAIAAKDDPNFKWTVRDPRNGEERVLSERELALIRRIQTGQPSARRGPPSLYVRRCLPLYMFGGASL